MRITAAAKAETRQRLLDAGADLFGRRGFDPTTTREIASSAGVATGTLFNYFPSKEALALALVTEAAAAGRADLATRHGERGSEASLDEALFALLAAEMRRLAACRPFLAEVLDGTLGPTAAAASHGGHRADHLEAVAGIVVAHGRPAPDFLALHLYWTLYLGGLAFWSRDESPGQEDTLALLDQSLGLFVRALDERDGATGDC